MRESKLFDDIPFDIGGSGSGKSLCRPRDQDSVHIYVETADTYHDRDMREISPEESQLPILRPKRATPFLLHPKPIPTPVSIPILSHVHSCKTPCTYRNTMRLVHYQSPQLILLHNQCQGFQEDFIEE